MKPAGTPSFVRLAGTVSPAELRIETLAGREVIAVPIVALKGGIVVRGLTSKGPEYIPPHVLEAAPEGWSGRPVLCAHPAGGKSTANTPETWNHESFGQCFNSTYSDGLLRMEAWLDPLKAEAVGDEAVEIVAKANAGEMFEVSTGAWVWLTEESGVAPNGDEYEYVWQAIVPDHLAVGLRLHGGVGACSIEAGCGGMRTMSAAQATAAKELTVKHDVLSRLAVALRGNAMLATLADASDRDVREALWKALRAIEPGFDWVVEFYPDSSTVIYICYPEDRAEWYQRTYTYADGVAKLNDDRVEVRPVTRYEPVASDTSSTVDMTVAANAGGCRCHENAQPDKPAAGQAHQGKGDAMKKSELAGRLIANAAAPFTDADRAQLEALSEAQLEAMDKSFTPVEPAKVEEKKEGVIDTAPAATPATDVVQLSRADHTTLLRLASREVAREKATHAQLSQLLLAASPAFTAEQLAAKPSDELVQLCTLAGIDVSPTSQLDYSGRGAHAVTALAETDPRSHTPPDPWKVPAALAASLGLTTTAQ